MGNFSSKRRIGKLRIIEVKNSAYAMYLFKRLSVFSPFDRSMVDEPTPEITNKLLLALNDRTRRYFVCRLFEGCDFSFFPNLFDHAGQRTVG